MGAAEVTAFLTSLAVQDKVAASTQNQALSALLFLYREVLCLDLPWLEDVVRAKRPQYLPVVLTRDETRALLQRLHGVPRIMALLLYGAGLRLLECCRLRVKDVDFAANQIVIRDGKGRKDRVMMLPATAKTLLARHIDQVRAQHEADLRRGAGWVELPGALLRKYPHAGREWAWQSVFPATRFYIPFHRPAPPPPSPRIRSPARREGRRPCRGYSQARHVPHPPTLLCHSPARGQPRHPDHPGTPRSPRRQYHDDLHACPQPGAGRRPKPRRPDVPVRTLLPADLEAAAGAAVLASEVLQDIWAQPPPRASQRHENSGRGQWRAWWSARIYRTV
jgi:Phage integrase family/Phage integrase, N-terminal SAM-like domain